MTMGCRLGIISLVASFGTACKCVARVGNVGEQYKASDRQVKKGKIRMKKQPQFDNIVTYAETMLKTIDEQPFNVVDNVILAFCAHFHFPTNVAGVCDERGVRLQEMFRAECFDDMFTSVWNPAACKRMFTAMCASPRFRDVVVKNFVDRYDEHVEKQFAAVTYQFGDKLCYVAFRGTDSTFVGWKEDFNMAFRFPVPSQTDALEYLNTVAKQCSCPIRVGGHSKGGNLAVYSAMFADDDVKQRIERVHSNDGPGFLKSVLETNAFASIVDKLEKVVPQSSFVGMLMEEHECYRVVKSHQSNILQHDPYSWEVCGCDFVGMDNLTPRAKCFDQALNQWIVSLPSEERERLVDWLFGLVDMDKFKTTEEWQASWRKNLSEAMRKISSADPATKQFVKRAIHELLELNKQNLAEMRKQSTQKSK